MQTATAGPGVGDVYAGQWRQGLPSGVAVCSFALNANNNTNALRYEGELAGYFDGVGVYFWRDGNRHAGGYGDGRRSGPGVHRFADGRRYEGEFANDEFNGHGVLWDADGAVISAGIWTDSQLPTSLSR